jgi:hypothetical protein
MTLCYSFNCIFRTTQIGVEIILSGWGLTKNIIFTPRYYLINQCSFNMEVLENEQQESKVMIESKKCVPFWPKSKTPQLIARIDGTKEVTKAFRYDKADQTLLQIPNKVSNSG